MWTLRDCTELIVLDWQQPAYHVAPARQALTWNADWKMSVYDDGDYCACLLGERLIQSLGRSRPS